MAYIGMQIGSWTTEILRLCHFMEVLQALYKLLMLFPNGLWGRSASYMLFSHYNMILALYMSFSYEDGEREEGYRMQIFSGRSTAPINDLSKTNR